VTCGSAVMASLGWKRSLRRSRDLRKPWIDPEEYVTGVGLKVSFSTLGKIMQCLRLAFFKVRCHLLGTALKVLLFNEEFLHSVICICCFGKVYPTLKIITDPSDEVGRISPGSGLEVRNLLRNPSAVSWYLFKSADFSFS